MRRQTAKCKYGEGDWFAVPLRAGGYAVGLVARASRTGGILLGYFFGPLRPQMPTLHDVKNHRQTDAVMVARFGDLGIINCEWQVLGHEQWNKSDWPMPRFARKDVISGRISLVEYDENDPGRELLVTPSDLTQQRALPDDGLYGYGAVELRLTKLLGADESAVIETHDDPVA